MIQDTGYRMNKSSHTKHKQSIWIIAGEVSGDLHAAGMVHHLRQLMPDTHFSGIGGPHLQSEGVFLHHHIDELAVMGFSEVLAKFRSIYKIFRTTVKKLKTEKPQALILVDFPDFNLRIARKAFKAGIPVIYYISPQLWAWRKRRINIIKKYVQKMIVIFPFEEEFYKQRGVDAYFTGYPLSEKLIPERYKNDQKKLTLTGDQNHLLIGVLPGSRNSEVKRNLPPLLKSIALIHEVFPQASFVLPRASTVSTILLQELIAQNGVKMKILDGQAYDVMGNADFLLIASGTATLEAACLTTPMIVVYRVSPFSYFIARTLVDIQHIAMANLVAGYRLVPELIQKELTADNVFQLARQFIVEPDRLKSIRAGLAEVREKLQSKDSYYNAARAIYQHLQRDNL